MINDIEKSLISRFLTSVDTTNAVRNAILEEVEKIKDESNLEKTNEEIGAEIRAKKRARELIHLAFTELHKYEITEKKSIKTKNPAR